MAMIISPWTALTVLSYLSQNANACLMVTDLCANIWLIHGVWQEIQEETTELATRKFSLYNIVQIPRIDLMRLISIPREILQSDDKIFALRQQVQVITNYFPQGRGALAAKAAITAGNNVVFLAYNPTVQKILSGPVGLIMGLGGGALMLWKCIYPAPPSKPCVELTALEDKREKILAPSQNPL